MVKTNGMSVQVNQILVMANVIFFLSHKVQSQAILVKRLHEFMVDKRFMSRDLIEQMDHFRRSMHMALYTLNPVLKNILHNMGTIDQLDDFFNRNSRNNMLFKVRLKLKGKHKKYMYQES